MSLSGVLVFILSLLLCMGISSVECKGNLRAGTPDGSEEWGYVEVRPKAHIFWWHYISPQRAGADWPIIMWLQGGPGASGTGIGNFQEVGPLDTQLQPRNTTWLQKADLLFVDSPVGTGFSYVENKTLLSKTDAQVAADLLTFLKEFFKNSTLQESPIFIVGESYGGKPTSMVGLALSKAIEAGDIKAKLGGVLLGDSWISPVDYVLSWGPLLKDVSRLELADAENVNSIALKIKEQIRKGKYLDATSSWSELESVIDSASNSVDFYNFLLDSSADPLSITTTLQSMARRSPQRYVKYLTSKQNIGQSGKNFDLSTFMNGGIRKKLQIIPSNIVWGEQSNAVFQALANDFMKSAVDVVDELLSRGEKVTIYNGQVDLICATIGTEAWVQQLKWRGLDGFNSTTRTPLYCNGTVTKGYLKSYKNLYFFWVLGAGHFIPVDNPCVALMMLDTVVNSHSTNNSM
ncbi:serine carboxypeptidase-like 51 isoform X2 [Cryptomeria japonica]|nr:serine carboxypeptidase-like 51 isoform X2 [Cryptomeria japonica]XP_057831210.1 serine carboxypeptidase-like 51 isoform X2 [Cryptomeria japonica]XP_057831211.1 serine carboxypeptidase-like 51 isoform X2 [Cryptomeria japonica]XP_057831212.1 serine carboxypeptidase-like 51 isoform X2 [Cryptomeria japonica]